MAAATNAFAPPGGVDCNADGIVDLPEGAPLVCTIPSTGAGIGSAIIAVVEAAAEPEPISITVDIKSGSGNNCIQPKSRGVISVAVLGSTVDVTQIDLATIQIDDDDDPSTAGVSPERSSFEDVDGDGKVDLVLKFRTQELNTAGMFSNGDSLFVTGGLKDGQQIRGSDSVSLVPKCHE
jgi:hypothetical protein